MELANPYALILFALALPILAIERRSLRSLTGSRRAASLALRLAVLAALVLALADPRIVRGVDRLAVAYLIDGSASVPPAERERAVEWVRQALAAKAPDDRAAVVVFGAEPLVERDASAVADLPSLGSQPDPGQTDLAAALRLSLGLLPSDAGRKVVVLSDGWETKGRALDEARLIGSAGVPVSVVPLDAGGGNEALVRDVDGPSLIREGEAYRLRATVDSTVASSGRLHLLVDGRVAQTVSVALHPGANAFVLPGDPLPPGFHTVQVHLDSLDPGADTLAENNEAFGYVTVAGRGRVLLVEGKPDEGRYLAEALRAGGLVVDSIAPTGLPTDLPSYGSYDGVVLANVRAAQLADSQMLGLRGAVQRLGTGLVVVGGDQSYGAGGYRRTALADALPVSMDVRGLRAQSAAALLLVIDTSGSMGEGVGGTTKMALAREAAIQALDLLSDADLAGVLAFEDTSSWVMPLAPLADRDAVRSAVSRLQAGGGTAIYPALEEAERAMAAANSKVRHIILLTDGISPGGDYASLIARLRAENITLSTVGVGLDADQALLRSLADAGNGRYYDGLDPFDLPQILVKDTLEVARAAIVEQDFRPLVVGASPVLEGVRPESLPVLRGYVATTPKAAAQVTLASPQLDPLLVEWQYGLGRVVAWTSDATNRWAASWLEWPDAVQFWTRLAKRSFPSPQDQSFQTQVSVEAGVAHVTVDAVGDGATATGLRNFLPLRLDAVGPDGQTVSADLTQVAPGRYVADLPAAGAGSYLVRVGQVGASDQAQGSQTIGFGVGYSPEYRQTGRNGELLRQLAEATGGRELADPAASVRHDLRARGGQPIWQWLTVLAAALFLADVAARRVRVSLAVARKTLAAAAATVRGWRGAALPRASEARLLAAKRRAPVANAGGRPGLGSQLAARARSPSARPAVGETSAPVARRPAPPRQPLAGHGPVRPSVGPPAGRPVGGRELGARLMEAKQRRKGQR